jgi:HEAT repeat protein
MRNALLITLLAALAAGDTGLDSHRWGNAVVRKTRRFEIRTNTFPELAAGLGERLEEAYHLFQDRFGPLTGDAGRPMRIELYRSVDQYLRLGDGVRGAVGHFDAALDRCALAWRGGNGVQGWPIAVHEACHHYVRRRHPNLTLPSWYAEGMACYFEGLQDPTVTDAVARPRVLTAQAALVSGDAQLERLLTTPARVVDGALRLDGFAPIRYYALCWSFVHFLATDDTYRARFRRFELRLFARRGRTGAIEDAMRILIEECGPLKRIERDWRAHLASLKRPRTPRPPPVYAWELRSKRPWVRYHALNRLLNGTLPPDLLTGVRRCLSDNDVVVRTMAVRVLGKRINGEVMEPLVKSLDAGDAELKRAVLRALRHPEARPAVPRLLAETAERALALDALAAIGDARAMPALQTALLDARLPPGTRARCAAALRADPTAVPTLRAAARDKSRAVRNAARATLIRLGVADGQRGGKLRSGDVERLIAVLDSGSESSTAKAHACTLLAVAKADAALAALKRLCGPTHPDFLRVEAARALVHITGETRGFAPGQPADARERALRRWTEG